MTKLATLATACGRMLIAAAMMVVVTACNKTDVTTWSEEVESRDGSVFVLEGKGERGASGFPFAHRGGVLYRSYYHRPSQAYWRAPGAYYPDGFDLIDGVPHVFMQVQNRIECIALNFPTNSLLVYRWSKQTGWERVSSENLPAGLYYNLLSNIFSERDKARDVHGFVSLQEKLSGHTKVYLADWIRENGNTCQKMKKPGLTVDYKMPVMTGFHREAPSDEINFKQFLRFFYQ